MLFSIFRLILLCASMYGYMRLARRWIARELTIGFTFALIASAMSLAGILNALPEAAVLLCAGGLGCLGWTLFRERQPLTLTLGGAFFLIMCAVLAIRVWGVKMVHYDNFSHWGLIVRHMLAKNRLPNYSDKYILFQAYPPAAASFIYYCTMLSGIRVEWFQLLAHWAFTAGMLAGLFCLAKDLPARVACFLGAALLLCGDNNFNQLLVDTALAAITLGAVAFCVHYRRDLRAKVLFLIPWLTCLVLTKNSGALFAVYALIPVFMWAGFKKGVAVAAAPALALLVWNRHVSYVFEQGLMAQHAMSLEHFKRMLSAKRASTVESVAAQMLQKVFSPSNEYLAVLLAGAAAFVFVTVFVKRDRIVRGLLVYGFAGYLIYQAGTAAMYIFTMPERQALNLASYNRYHGTICIFCAGILLMAVMLLSRRVREKPRGAMWSKLCCGLCVAAIAVSGIPDYEHYTRLPDESREKIPIRDAVDALLARFDIPSESSYYILVGNDFAATPYLTNAMNCLLLAQDVQVRRLNQILSEDEAFNCEYLIAFEDAPEVMDYVEQHFGAREQFIHLSEVPREATEAQGGASGNLAELMKQAQGGGASSGNLAEQMKQAQGASSGNLAEQMNQAQGASSGNLAEQMKQGQNRGSSRGKG